VTTRLDYRRPLISLLFAALLTVCGGSSGSAAAIDSINPAIAMPVGINPYPTHAAASLGRLVVMLMSVGSASVGMPMIFESGSVGTSPVQVSLPSTNSQPMLCFGDSSSSVELEMSARR
jgi:hypothetical protein